MIAIDPVRCVGHSNQQQQLAQQEIGGTRMAQTAEVVIIGGGIVGASIAYNLRQDGMTGRILVIERDATYTRAATPLSMGGVRQQYSVPCNIAMARYGLAFYEQFDEVRSEERRVGKE